MRHLQISDGEFEFLKDYGVAWGDAGNATDALAARIGLRTLIEEHLTRDYANRPRELKESFGDLGPKPQ